MPADVAHYDATHTCTCGGSDFVTCNLNGATVSKRSVDARAGLSRCQACGAIYRLDKGAADVSAVQPTLF